MKSGFVCVCILLGCFCCCCLFVVPHGNLTLQSWTMQLTFSTKICFDKQAQLFCKQSILIFMDLQVWIVSVAVPWSISDLSCDLGRVS